jgi:hypothetical protein
MKINIDILPTDQVRVTSDRTTNLKASQVLLPMWESLLSMWESVGIPVPHRRVNKQ